MNLLFLTYNLVGRGTYLRAEKLAYGLAVQGHHVTLVASQNTSSSVQTHKAQNLDFVFFPTSIPRRYFSGWDLGEARRRTQYLSSYSFDLVHTFEHRPVCQIPAEHFRNKGSVVVSDWADWLGKGGSVEQRPSWIVRQFLRGPETRAEVDNRKLASAVSVISTKLYERCIEMGFDAKSILLLPNGYHNSIIIPMNKLDAKQHIGVKTDRFIVGYLGSSFQSDMMLMNQTIRMANFLSKEFLFLQIGLNKYAPEDSESVMKTGLVDHTDLLAYLSACDVFWLPLRNSKANAGRLPYKFSDYLSIGRPIVSTCVGDQAQIIEKEGLGRVVIDEPEALLMALDDLKSNPSMCNQIGDSALLYSLRPENSWEAKSIDLDLFYRQIKAITKK